MDAATLFVANDTLSSQLTIPPGSSVYIADTVTLTVDDTLLLTNSEIVLGSRAKIVVSDSSKLTLKGCFLHGCDSLWDGIFAAPGSVLVSDTSSGNTRCKIEDALNGITAYSTNGAKFFIRHTDFYRSQNGIRLMGYTPIDSLSYYVSDCNFGMGDSGQMLPAPAGYYNLSHPFSGISLWWCGPELSFPNINLADSLPNTFSDMTYGIYALGCGSVNIYNNYFSDIRNYEQLPFYGAGAAVWGGSLGFAGMIAEEDLYVQTQSTAPADTSPVHFKRCDFGVFGNRLKVNVKNTRMDSVTHGVKTMDSRYRVWISENYITHTNFGISLNNNVGAVNKVWSNTIQVNPPNLVYFRDTSGLPYAQQLNTYGIAQAEMNRNIPVSSNIYFNHIYGGRNGIAVNNANGVQVWSNTLVQNDSDAIADIQNGIYTTNCSGVRVEGNSVTGNGPDYCDNLAPDCYDFYSAKRKQGYGFYMSTGEFCNNTADSIGYATFFAGNCNGMSVRKNDYDKSKFAMVLHSSGFSQVLGDQGYDSIAVNSAQGHENEFIGSGTMHSFANDSNFRSMSIINIPEDSVYIPPKFYYTGSQSLSNVFYPDTGGAIVNGVPNFRYRIQPVHIQSTHVTNYQCATVYFPYIQHWDLLVAGWQGEKYMELGYGSVGNWLAKRQLFNKLRADTSLLQADTLMRTFYDSVKTTTIGDISDYELKLLHLTDSATLHDTAQYSETLSQADGLLDVISASNKPENNFVKINQIYLALLHADIDTFTAAQVSTIQHVAGQCPFAAGDAVYMARTLLAQFDNRYFYNDVALCATAQSGKKGSYEAGNTQQDTIPLKRNEFIRVFPNPASDRLNVVFEAKVAGMVKFELMTLRGQVLKTVYIEKGTNYVTFSLGDLPDAAYMWRLSDRARAIGSGTVVIQRR